MKKFLFLLTVSLVLFKLSAQNLQIEPRAPQNQATLQLKYDPKGTPLEDSGEIMCLAIVFEEKGYKMQDIDLTNQAGVYEGKFTLPAGATAAAFTVTDPNSRYHELNGGDPVILLVNGPDGRPIKTAQANLAQFFLYFISIWGGTSDHSKALDLLEKEIAAFPEQEVQLAPHLAQLIEKVKPDSFQAHVKQSSAKFLNKKKANEKDLIAGYELAKLVKDEGQMSSIAASITKKYPKGEFVKLRKIESFYVEDDLNKKIALEEEIRKVYGRDEQMEQMIDQLNSHLTLAAAESGHWDLFQTYYTKIKNPNNLAGMFNNLAWAMTGEEINAPAKDLSKAKMLSEKSLELIEKAKSSQIPINRSPKQWKRDLEANNGIYADTYALILYKEGRMAEARKYQKIAMEKSPFISPDMEERYAFYLAKGGEQVEAEKILEKLIKENKATNEAKLLYQEVFLKNHTVESAYKKYFTKLEEEGQEKLVEKIRKSLINEETPAFSLTNLKGETVSSDQLKNKVVILDFWATWCGPCKQSFPGMQKLVERYKTDPKVEILFVDCWENAEEKLKNAQDFVTKNNYTFNVLMDNENKVVSDFKVEGVPTKFVLDTNGRVRHKSVGFSGTADKMVNEMVVVIELLKKEVEKN